MSYTYTNVTEHIIAPTVKSIPIICFPSFLVSLTVLSNQSPKLLTVIINNIMYNRCNYNQFRHQIACFTNYTHTLSFTVGFTVVLACWRVCVDNNTGSRSYVCARARTPWKYPH